jgi:hypothetical protein
VQSNEISSKNLIKNHRNNHPRRYVTIRKEILRQKECLGKLVKDNCFEFSCSRRSYPTETHNVETSTNHLS